MNNKLNPAENPYFVSVDLDPACIRKQSTGLTHPQKESSSMTQWTGNHNQINTTWDFSRPIPSWTNRYQVNIIEISLVRRNGGSSVQVPYF